MFNGLVRRAEGRRNLSLFRYRLGASGSVDLLDDNLAQNRLCKNGSGLLTYTRRTSGNEEEWLGRPLNDLETVVPIPQDPAAACYWVDSPRLSQIDQSFNLPKYAVDPELETYAILDLIGRDAQRQSIYEFWSVRGSDIKPVEFRWRSQLSNSNSRAPDRHVQGSSGFDEAELAITTTRLFYEDFLTDPETGRALYPIVYLDHEVGAYVRYFPLPTEIADGPQFSGIAYAEGLLLNVTHISGRERAYEGIWTVTKDGSARHVFPRRARSFYGALSPSGCQLVAHVHDPSLGPITVPRDVYLVDLCEED